MDKAAGGEPRSQPIEQRFGELTLFLAERGGIPFRTFHVVDRHERRLASLGKPHILRRQISVDLFTQGVDCRPLRACIGLGDPWILVHAGHAHCDVELRVADIGGADDRRRITRVGGARQRDMTLAGEESRGWIEPDPARAG